jgi:hypothetical protein
MSSNTLLFDERDEMLPFDTLRKTKVFAAKKLVETLDSVPRL